MLHALLLHLQIQLYGNKESSQLALELTDAIPGAGADLAKDDLDASAGTLASGLPVVFGALRRALERCIALSSGTALPALLGALDGALTQHISRLRAGLNILARRFREEAGALAPGVSSAGEDVGVILALVQLGNALQSQLAGLEAALRSAIATWGPRVSSLAVLDGERGREAAVVALIAGELLAASTTPGAQMLAMRLAVFPASAAPLVRLAEAAGEPRFIALPASVQAVDAFRAAVADAVRGALLTPVTSALSGLEALPEWASDRGGDGLVPGLPTFNAYPLAYMTAIGEYLMRLPQALEVLVEDNSGAGTAQTDAAGGSALTAEAGEELAAQWLDDVVAGAAGMWLEAVLRLPAGGVGVGGGAQLAADAEYLANVMGALGVSVPPALITCQIMAGAAIEGWPDAAAAAIAEGSGDARTLRALAKLRGIEFGYQPQQQQQQPVQRLHTPP